MLLPPMAATTPPPPSPYSSKPRAFSPNSSIFTAPISNHLDSHSPTTPKSFNGLSKPFHSRIPTSISWTCHSCCRRGFSVKASVIKWDCAKPTLPPNCHIEFQIKALYLESIGIDSFSLIENNPMLSSVSLAHIKSVVEFMTSMDFTAIEFRRIVGMCPEILSSQVSDIIPAFTFLIREAHVNGSDIKRVINRRPRLLVCSVNKQLCPTLYFLQSIGIELVNKHTYLLSCSVEEKLLQRIDYLENIVFSRCDATSMFRRFPQLFCYSIKNNLEPKYNYFVVI